MNASTNKVATLALNILFAACIIGYAASAFYFHVNVPLFQFLAGTLAVIVNVMQFKKERKTLTKAEIIVEIIGMIFIALFTLDGLVHLFG